MAEGASLTNIRIPHTCVTDLWDECRDLRKSPTYIAKMFHPIPEVAVFEHREYFFLAACSGETVLDIGASGELHTWLTKVAQTVYGVDLEASEGVVAADLDDIEIDQLPRYPGVTRVCCGEILEHLSNPGWLLKRLRRTYPVPLIVSVPNAFSATTRYHLEKYHVENVNRDHVAWYSPKTLEWLLARHGYRIVKWAWYGSKAYTAEGIVAFAEPV